MLSNVDISMSTFTPNFTFTAFTDTDEKRHTISTNKHLLKFIFIIIFLRVVVSFVVIHDHVSIKNTLYPVI